MLVALSWLKYHVPTLPFCPSSSSSGYVVDEHQTTHCLRTESINRCDQENTQPHRVAFATPLPGRWIFLFACGFILLLSDAHYDRNANDLFACRTVRTGDKHRHASFLNLRFNASKATRATRCHASKLCCHEVVQHATWYIPQIEGRVSNQPAGHGSRAGNPQTERAAQLRTRWSHCT